MTTKRKLLVVAGAGSSIELGMPSVAGVDKILGLAALQQFRLADDPTRSLYDHIRDVITSCWHDNWPSRKGTREPNFEDVLYAIYALAGSGPTDALTSVMASVAETKPVPDIIRFNERVSPIRPTFLELSDHLLHSLMVDFRSRCENAEREPQNGSSEFKCFFLSLCEHFQLTVVTLNYDDLIYKALPGAETGFDLANNGHFYQRRIFESSRWPRILHLHGSVHFGLDTVEGDLNQIVWRERFVDISTSRNGGKYFLPEGIAFSGVPIIAGHGKLMQLLGFPYRTYVSELDRAVFDSDAVLFLGYGFGDSHINRPFGAYRDNRNRPVVAIDFACDNALTASAGNDAHPAAFAAASLFRNHQNMSWLGYSFPDGVGLLKAENEFERSTDPTRPLSLWYGGMLSAVRHSRKIFAELGAV